MPTSSTKPSPSRSGGASSWPSSTTSAPAEHLTEIMESAYTDSDPAAAFYAGRARQHYMLARYYVKLPGRQHHGDADRVQGRDRNRCPQNREAVDRTQNPRRVELADMVSSGLAQYAELFEAVYEAIVERNRL